MVIPTSGRSTEHSMPPTGQYVFVYGRQRSVRERNIGRKEKMSESQTKAGNQEKFEFY